MTAQFHEDEMLEGGPELERAGQQLAAALQFVRDSDIEEIEAWRFDRAARRGTRL
jgi:hypothetical protein